MTHGISPDLMRLLLLACLLSMELLAGVYLSRRRLPFFAYLGWGLLAILLPVVGPFLVIWRQPGRPAFRQTRKVHAG